MAVSEEMATLGQCNITINIYTTDQIMEEYTDDLALIVQQEMFGKVNDIAVH